jgi:hypothetical protein
MSSLFPPISDAEIKFSKRQAACGTSATASTLPGAWDGPWVLHGTSKIPGLSSAAAMTPNDAVYVLERRIEQALNLENIPQIVVLRGKERIPEFQHWGWSSVDALRRSAQPSFDTAMQTIVDAWQEGFTVKIQDAGSCNGLPGFEPIWTLMQWLQTSQPQPLSLYADMFLTPAASSGSRAHYDYGDVLAIPFGYNRQSPGRA